MKEGIRFFWFIKIIILITADYSRTSVICPNDMIVEMEKNSLVPETQTIYGEYLEAYNAAVKCRKETKKVIAIPEKFPILARKFEKSPGGANDWTGLCFRVSLSAFYIHFIYTHKYVLLLKPNAKQRFIFFFLRH